MEKLNLPPFYVGQKVVCVESHPTGAFKKGNEFTIKEIKKGCCSYEVNIGVTLNHEFPYIDCPKCGTTEPNSNFFASNRFVAMQEKTFPLISFSKVLEEMEVGCN